MTCDWVVGTDPVDLVGLDDLVGAQWMDDVMNQGMNLWTKIVADRVERAQGMKMEPGKVERLDRYSDDRGGGER